jgi:hypothetical protein
MVDPDRDIRLLKEGFSWPAFLFSVIWALWHRLWLVAAGFFVAEVLINAALAALRVDPWTPLAIGLGLALLFGLLANDLHRWTLFRRGYLEIAVVTGSDMDMAERRFWDQRPHLAADLVR